MCFTMKKNCCYFFTIKGDKNLKKFEKTDFFLGPISGRKNEITQLNLLYLQLYNDKRKVFIE